MKCKLWLWSLCLCGIVLLVAVSGGVAKYAPKWESLDQRPLPAWFDSAKIGIFLHWGVYSVPSYGTGASEWMWAYWRGHDKALTQFMQHNYKPGFTYAEFAPHFTAELFNPTEWAELFRKAGARYVVLTSKHHDGYTLWPSKHSYNWNAMEVGPRRDLVGELARAVRGAKLHFGLYHSLLEWYHPVYNQDRHNKWQTQEFPKHKVRPEMEELVNTYHPEVIWADGDWENPDTYWNSTDFLAWLYNESPVRDTVVVNDRWGKGIPCSTHGDFLSCKDRFRPGKLQSKKWESAMTLDKASWGYRRNAHLHDYLSIEELVSFLVSTISCGGNLLINVGPTSYGTIAPIFQERLIQLGQWLTINGEAIYESHPWTHQNDTISPDLWYTERDGHVYAIVLKYQAKVVMGAVDPAKVSSVQLLGVNQSVEFTKNQNSSGMVVHFPPLTPNDHVKYAYTFKLTMKV